MNYDDPRRLRKVAVLVASLGEPLARPLLDELSPREADKVRSAVEQLGTIDPEERQDILDEFLHTATLSQQRHSGAVELETSLLEKIQQKPGESFAQIEPITTTNHRWLADAQPSAIAELLADEHPQTAAVVVSRLPVEQAAQVLQALAPTLQSDLLARMVHLDTTDPQAMDVVETHLNDRIDQQQQRQQRMAAGLKLVNDILQRTTPKQQSVLLENLTHRDPSLAKRFRAAQPKERPKPVSRVSQSRFASDQAAGLQAAIASAQKSMAHSQTPEAPSPIRKVVVAQQQAEVSHPMEELERCDEVSLQIAIGRLDPQTVSLALVGASDQMLKQILRRLPRGQAKLFRKQLLVSDPTRLSDMLAAQRKLLATAWNIAGRT